MIAQFFQLCYTMYRSTCLAPNEVHTMKKSHLVAAGAAVSAAAAASVLGAAYGIYRFWFYHAAQPEDISAEELSKTLPYGDQLKQDAEALAAAAYEPVQITADDGTLLAARYYHHADGAPVAIIFHGYKGFARRDGMGGYTLCKQLGYNVLLPDQRSHGASGGHTITMGVKERYDCRAWAYWAYKHFGPDTPLFLMGVSMGASTVLLASGLDLPRSVKGIIADCGYTSPHDICRRVLAQTGHHLPVGPIYTVGRLGTLLFGHFDPEDADCRQAVAKTRIPILFLHGEADDFVPCEMSRENYDACASRKRLVTIPGAGHAVAYYVDIPAYRKAVTDFLQECLQTSDTNQQ